jgi:hypothetical protein
MRGRSRLGLMGCATKMSQEERLALKRVSIGAIELPEKPFVLAPGAGGAALFGGALGMALANAATDIPTALKDHVAKNNIDVAAYVRGELVSQLRSKDIEVVDGNRADAVLVVQLLQYGLTGPFSSDDRFPFVQLRLSLVNKKGERVWLGYAASHVIDSKTSGINPRPIPQFFKDARLLERDFKKAANIVVSSATKDL